MNNRKPISFWPLAVTTFLLVQVTAACADSLAPSREGADAVPLAQTAQPDEASVDIPLPETTSKRVIAGAKVQPGMVSSRQTPWIFVKVRIAPGYHIYSLSKSLNSSIPTRVEVELPKGTALAGKWEAPEPKKLGGALVYQKEVVFRNRLIVAETVPPGTQKMKVKVAFQACNEAACWPLESLAMEVEFEVVKDSVTK